MQQEPYGGAVMTPYTGELVSGTFFGQKVDREKIATQVFENALHHLEQLRADVERTNNQGIGDVRQLGESTGASLLRGVDYPIDYSDLAGLVQDFKAGIARRRVAMGQI